MTAWHLALPYAKPPLTLNQRLRWQAKARITKRVRLDAAVLMRAAVRAEERNAWPLDHVDVDLVWRVADRRRRDADNLTATLKALCDGLVDAGIVRDDTPEWMTKRMPSISHTTDPIALATPLVLIVSVPQ